MSSKIISASEAAEMGKNTHDVMVEKFNELLQEALSEHVQHFYILKPSFGGDFTDTFLNEISEQGYVLNYNDYGYDTIGVFWGDEAKLEEKSMQ